MELNSYLLSIWSDMIRERDEYICQLSLNRYMPSEVSAHHVLPKHVYPHLAYRLDNGITISGKLHNRVIHSDSRNERRMKLLWQPYLTCRTVQHFNATRQTILDYKVRKLIPGWDDYVQEQEAILILGITP